MNESFPRPLFVLCFMCFTFQFDSGSFWLTPAPAVDCSDWTEKKKRGKKRVTSGGAEETFQIKCYQRQVEPDYCSSINRSDPFRNLSVDIQTKKYLFLLIRQTGKRMLNVDPTTRRTRPGKVQGTFHTRGAHQACLLYYDLWSPDKKRDSDQDWVQWSQTCSW